MDLRYNLISLHFKPEMNVLQWIGALRGLDAEVLLEQLSASWVPKGFAEQDSLM